MNDKIKAEEYMLWIGNGKGNVASIDWEGTVEINQPGNALELAKILYEAIATEGVSFVTSIEQLQTENERLKKQIDDLERLPLEMELIKERNEKLQADFQTAYKTGLDLTADLEAAREALKNEMKATSMLLVQRSELQAENELLKKQNEKGESK